MANFFQNLMMGGPKRANWSLSHFSENLWEALGKKRASSTYKIASTRVPAYKEFLKIQGVDDKKNSFEHLPLTNKGNYLQKYPFHKRLVDAAAGLHNIHSFTKSSGSTGKPIYWPRYGEADDTTEKILAFTYDYLYQIFRRSTLIVSCLALGTWTAGEQAGDASRRVSTRRHSKSSVISPGANDKEAAEIIKDLYQFYDQVVVICYPPFAKQVLDELDEINVDLRKINLKFMVGGEGFSEHYRDYLYKRLKSNKINNVIGIYASSDAGFIGSESPLSILVKQEALKNSNLAQDLFGRKDINHMTLIQYSPIGRYFESINKELVVTIQQAVPLVRYNTKDMGGIIKFSQVIDTCSKHNFYTLKDLSGRGFNYSWKLPFLYIFGKSDNTISIGGANIYPENIKTAVEKFGDVNSFKLKSSLDKRENTKFNILVELNKKCTIGNKGVSELKKEIHSTILDKLLAVNDDFADAYRIDPDSLNPEIVIFEYDEGPFKHKSIKHKYIKT